MALDVDNNGNITLYQGDSGKITFNGLGQEGVEKTVYFAIQDENRNPIGDELVVTTTSDSVSFVLTPSFTDLLTVPNGEDYATYYYGVKVCNSEGEENTVIIGGSGYDSKNTITVYPKKVEGTI